MLLEDSNRVIFDTMQMVIVPLKQIEYGFGHITEDPPIYPIFYLPTEDYKSEVTVKSHHRLQSPSIYEAQICRHGQHQP